MSTATATEVLAGNARWSCETADAIEFIGRQPDDSIDLLFTSPPYLEARTYGIAAGRLLEEWVAWMVELVRAAWPKVKGLIAVNCEGQTRDFRYLPAPLLLGADLHRAGFNLRKPVAFHRIGIPGSGGPDWFRNDWEHVICVTRPGKLLWSDNTACGHPPKWAPGGAMSYRLTDGQRVNQWGRTGGIESGGERGEDGKRHRKGRPSHVFTTPGNMVERWYQAAEVASMLREAGDLTHHNVGGNAMGSNVAHENEAPFPFEFAERFVLSFCPPGGVVADPFSGSGTTCEASVVHGRRFVGCDIRRSQADLCRRRMKATTPRLFAAIPAGDAPEGRP